MQANFGRTQKLVLTGMFGAIIFLLQFTPLGFPQIPLIGSATILHIPVIIGGNMLGPKYGAILGFMFGFSSLVFASTQSIALNAFAFTPFRPVPGTGSGSPWSLLIAFGPRILVGVVPPLVFMGLTKIFPLIDKKIKQLLPGVFAEKEPRKCYTLSLTIAAVAGSLTNTLLVLHLLYFIFREPWSLARAGAEVVNPQITYAFIASTIVMFGIPEAIVAGLVTPAVCLALFAVARQFAPIRQGSQ